MAGLLAAAVGALTACGDDGGSEGGPDPAGDAGTVLDEEFLGHELREVPDPGDAPRVQLQLSPDDHGGWNLHLQTEHFTFTPEDVNGPAHAGQGHAHVYVDDEKYSRVYSEWFFLPADAVGSGEHELLVTLNADDHTVWAVDGEPVAATTTVDGDATGHDHDHGGTPDPAPTGEASEVFAFEIADGRASPPLERAQVSQGATVRIEVTSDQPDEIHLHGYDESAEVAPGEPAVIELVADRTGLFELETHDTGLLLLQLQVQ